MVNGILYSHLKYTNIPSIQFESVGLKPWHASISNPMFRAHCLMVSYLVVTHLFESEFLSTKLHCNKAILYLVVLEYLKIGTYF